MKLTLITLLTIAGLTFAFTFTHSGAQEAVRINVNITDNEAERRNLDAFVAKFGCVIDANADATVKRTRRRQCREAAILRFMEDVEDAYEGDTAFIPARQAAINARKGRWQAGVAPPTPTPTPTPTPVPQQ